MSAVCLLYCIHQIQYFFVDEMVDILEGCKPGYSVEWRGSSRQLARSIVASSNSAGFTLRFCLGVGANGPNFVRPQWIHASFAVDFADWYKYQRNQRFQPAGNLSIWQRGINTRSEHFFIFSTI